MLKINIPTCLLILYRPTRAVERIETKRSYWPPLLFLCFSLVVLGVVAGYVQPYVDTTLLEQGEKVEEVAVFSAIFYGFFMLFIIPIFMLIEALLIFGVLKLFKKTVSFRYLFILILYVSLVLEPATFFACFLVNPMLDGPQVTALSYWVPTSGVLEAVLDQIEIASIWETIITFFALRKLAQLNTLQAYMITGIIFLFFCLVGIALYA